MLLNRVLHLMPINQNARVVKCTLLALNVRISGRYFMLGSLHGLHEWVVSFRAYHFDWVLTKRTSSIHIIFHVGRLITFYVISVNVNQKLLFAYYYSLYGSVLQNLNSPHVEAVCITWCKGFHKVWRLPPDKHCALLPLLSNSLPVIDKLAKQFIRCLQQCLSQWQLSCKICY